MPKSQRLKVGLVFDDSLDSNDGVAQHVKTLGAWLLDQGYEVRFLVGETKATKWHGGKIYSLARNRKVNFNGNKLSVPMPASARKIRAVLKDEKFDVLHVMMPYSPFMAQKIIKLASPSTAIVGTFHIYPAGKLSRAGARLLRLSYGQSLKKFSEVVSVSSAAAGFAKDFFGLDSKVIPNPVNLEQFKSAKPNKSERSDHHIVFLGRLVKRKGCRELLEAMAILSVKLPSARLTIAGDGPLKPELEELTRKLGIEDKTEFLGFIEEKYKASLLSNADLACCPSLYGESFGIVLVEAMAAGSGVVLGGDNPGYRSVLGSQPKLLVDPTDKSGLAERMLELLTDPSLRKQIYKWQQKELIKYDINTVGPQVVNTYSDAIARFAKTRHNNAYE